jgi:hypothetical protein
MTVDPDSEDARTNSVGEIREHLESYADHLAQEQQTVQGILESLETADPEKALDAEEYRKIFPAEMPLEEWRGQ